MSQPPPRDEPTLSAAVAAHLRSTPPSGECPDAEALAVYAEGESLADEQPLIEAHLASCLRCQAHLAAMVRSEPQPVSSSPSAADTLRWWQWIVPMTSAALVILAVYVTRPSPAPETQVDQQEAQTPSVPPPAPRLEGAPPVPPVASATPESERRIDQAPSAPAGARRREADRSATASRDTRAEKGGEPTRPQEATSGGLADRSQAAPPARPASAPNAAAGAAPRERVAADELKTFAAPTMWRLASGGVERTTDGGKTWTTAFRPQGVTLRAIAAPSPTVCWAVGDDGAIFRTIDGVTWAPIRFPERVPLVSVDAPDADHAVVTATDGRRFATEDGGAQWRSVSAW